MSPPAVAHTEIANRYTSHNIYTVWPVKDKSAVLFSQVTVNELFQDVTYQPVLLRAHSHTPVSPVSVSDTNRLSPLAMPDDVIDDERKVPHIIT